MRFIRKRFDRKITIVIGERETSNTRSTRAVSFIRFRGTSTGWRNGSVSGWRHTEECSKVETRYALLRHVARGLANMRQGFDVSTGGNRVGHSENHFRDVSLGRNFGGRATIGACKG